MNNHQDNYPIPDTLDMTDDDNDWDDTSCSEHENESCTIHIRQHLVRYKVVLFRGSYGTGYSWSISSGLREMPLPR